MYSQFPLPSIVCSAFCFSADLHLGCLQLQNNHTSFNQPVVNATSPYKCAQACAKKKLPLAAVFNSTACHCLNNTFASNVSNISCVGSQLRIFQVYNTSSFMVVFAELYQKLFILLPLNIAQSPSANVTQLNGTARTLSDIIEYSIDFGDRRVKTVFNESVKKIKTVHRYVTKGEFNVTLMKSRGNSSKAISFRTIKVFIPHNVTDMKCHNTFPGKAILCTVSGTTGSDVTVRLQMGKIGQNTTLTVPGKSSQSQTQHKYVQ